MIKTKKYYEDRYGGALPGGKRIICILLSAAMLFGYMLFTTGEAWGATVYGALKNSYWKGYMTYTTSTTATSYTVKVTAAGPYASDGWVQYPFKTTLSATGFASVSGSMATARIDKGSKKNLITKTFTWSKGTVSATKTVKASTKNTYNDAVSTATKTFTVPALAKYTISYNANGGSGAPAAQTKYYGRALTLSSVRPVRAGYSFLGWALSSAAAARDYSAGGTYSANVSDTLYAVWKKLPEDMVCVDGDIIWDDDENRDGIRPEKTTVYIKNGSVTAAAVSGISDFSSGNLKKKDSSGKLIAYTVSAEEVPGYTCSVFGMTVTFRHRPEIMTVDGKILWKDSGDKYGARPSVIRAELLKYEEFTDEETGLLKREYVLADTYDVPTGENPSIYAWSVYRYEDGKEQRYMVDIKDEPDGYEISHDGKATIFTYIESSRLINMQYAFYGCKALKKCPEIKQHVKNAESAFEGCTALEGDITVNADPDKYSGCFKDTSEIIRLTGDCTDATCAALRNTSPQGNVMCGHDNSYDENTAAAAVYYDASEDRIIAADESFPECGDNDRYQCGEYEYTYHSHFDSDNEYDRGWSVRLNPKTADMTAESYGKIQEYINGEPVTGIVRTFENCLYLKSAPKIPASATNMYAAFKGCKSLAAVYAVPRSVINLSEAFESCVSLEGYIEINTDTKLVKRCFDKTVKTIDIAGQLGDEACRLLRATSENGNIRCGELHEGMTYYDASEDIVLEERESFPAEVETGDIFTYAGFEYGCNAIFNPQTGKWEIDTSVGGWSVNAIEPDSDRSEILQSIRNIKVVAN